MEREEGPKGSCSANPWRCCGEPVFAQGWQTMALRNLCVIALLTLPIGRQALSCAQELSTTATPEESPTAASDSGQPAARSDRPAKPEKRGEFIVGGVLTEE